MTPPEYDATVHRLLGELAAGVKNLQESFRRSEDKSDQSRAAMHIRMDAMIERVGKVEATVVGVEGDIKDMKPVVDKVTSWENRGIGAFSVIAIGSSAVTTIILLFVSQFFNQILAWFSRS